MSKTSLPSNTPAQYTVTGSSSSGGQGKVFVCRDSNLSRDVAIKVLHSRGNPRDLAAEVAALGTIQSKHVVQIFDVIIDSANKVVGLVQEYLPGSDVGTFSGVDATLEEYLRVLFQIASGIADIHASDKIHRDIKPANMRFDEENIIKIFDFGLSCDKNGDPATVAARGTLGYRAPELYPAGGNFNEKVDVYAFGVLAWELAGGMLPAELLEMPPQTTSEVVSISTHAIGVPLEISEIIDGSLKLDSSKRPSMAKVRDVIARRLLYGKHKAVITSGTHTYELNKLGTVIKIAHGSYGAVDIEYNGLDFVIKSSVGDVYFNGMSVVVGMSLPDSCVLIIGAPSLQSSRLFLPFNSSHPEVIL